MDGLGSVISALIWMFAIMCIIASSLKKASSQKRINAIKNSSYVPNEKIYAAKKSSSPAVPVKQVQAKAGAGMILKDDIANDWLAGQLREESKAMTIISDMFQLKAQHTNSCDAEFIRRFHESSCDADGVDDGTRKQKKR
ncbi:MAG: hypothetical protein IKS84_02270 [Lachnospiraceae bacterium]|nr:hypothetical protein [Lachnospiraceae bacterium]MBR6485058.1 hypothetical protein [Lachnospiraceae bacterium]